MRQPPNAYIKTFSITRPQKMQTGTGFFSESASFSPGLVAQKHLAKPRKPETPSAMRPALRAPPKRKPRPPRFNRVNPPLQIWACPRSFDGPLLVFAAPKTRGQTAHQCSAKIYPVQKLPRLVFRSGWAAALVMPPVQARLTDTRDRKQALTPITVFCGDGPRYFKIPPLDETHFNRARNRGGFFAGVPPVQTWRYFLGAFFGGKMPGNFSMWEIPKRRRGSAFQKGPKAT
ncbi:MAG: hypothetical protein CM15mP21_1540 [Hyphomicrobiales bacterium]|nr:MAG: hypothetical protein CM15mP21_1540 [Hyphomicrobiales bacterium]